MSSLSYAKVLVTNSYANLTPRDSQTRLVQPWQKNDISIFFDIIDIFPQKKEWFPFFMFEFVLLSYSKKGVVLLVGPETLAIP